MKLRDNNCNFNIRITVTADNCENLYEDVKYVISKYNPIILHISPVALYGRGKKEKKLDYRILSKECVKIIDYGYQNDKIINIPGTSIDSFKFSGFNCGLINNFNVLPNGYISSCHEVGFPEDNRFSSFIYGNFDELTCNLNIDKKSLVKIMDRFNVKNRIDCSNCFCKYTCSGNCPARFHDIICNIRHKGKDDIIFCNYIKFITFYKLLTSFKEARK